MGAGAVPCKGSNLGCNYYLQAEPPCPTCGRVDDERVHIGKSRAGWYFALHVIPELGINTLDDWRNLWSAPGAVIRNEYGGVMSVSDMELVITVRYGRDRWDARGTSSEAEMHRMNHSEWGEYNLLRSLLGKGCVGHGEGPWSYFTGDFS